MSFESFGGASYNLMRLRMTSDDDYSGRYVAEPVENALVRRLDERQRY